MIPHEDGVKICTPANRPWRSRCIYRGYAGHVADPVRCGVAVGRVEEQFIVYASRKVLGCLKHCVGLLAISNWLAYSVTTALFVGYTRGVRNFLDLEISVTRVSVCSDHSLLAIDGVIPHSVPPNLPEEWDLSNFSHSELA